MKHLKTFFAFMLMAVLSIGQVWGAIDANSTWTATAFADLPDGATVIIINNFGKSLANATVTKAPAKVAASFSSTTKKITVSTTGKSLDDIAWTVEQATNGTKFWVYGSTTNLLGLSKTNDNNAVAVNTTSNVQYNEFVLDGGLLKYYDVARYVGEYVSGSDWRSYNSATANNYKSGSTTQSLTFYVLDDAPADPFTVTLMDNSATLTEASAGAGVTLPSRDGCEGYTFAGWTNTWTAAQSSWTETAPDIILAGTYHPSADENLYPVYTKVESSSSSGFTGYTQIALGETITDGQYLISTGSFTMAGSGKTGASYTPGSTEKTEYEYTISVEKGKFTILGPDGKYIGGVDNTTLQFADAASDDAYRWTYASTGIQNVGTNTRHIKGYQTTDFRHYATSNGTLTYLYKRTEGGSTSTTYYISEPPCCTKRAISIASGITNGSVSADPVSACEGATITLTFTPALNYHLSAWTLNGEAQDIAENTFTMPAAAVTVSATFAQDACEPLGTPSVTVSGKAYPYDAVQLAWTAIEHADAYKVYIYDAEDNELEHNDAVTGVEYTIGQTLSGNTTYKYSVQAISNTPATYCPSTAATGSLVTEALPTAHLTLVYPSGTHASSGDYPILTPFNLPDAATVIGCTKVFRGWDRSSTCAVAPEFAPGASFTFENTTGVTLYAVYATAGPGAPVTYPVDFEANADTYTNWTFTNITSKQSDSNVSAHGDSYLGVTDAKATASIQTKEKIAKPASLTVYVSKKSTNTTASTWYAQVSTDGSNWTNVESVNGASMSKGAWVELSADLSSYFDVYVRVYYDGSTAVRCIDDLVLSAVGSATYSEYSTKCEACKAVTLEKAGEDSEKGNTFALKVDQDVVTSVATCEAASVTIVPTVATGYQVSFAISELTGASLSENTISLAANANGALTVTATYTQKNHKVTLAQSPAAGATLVGGKDDAHYNETVNLSTDVPTGYTFINWTSEDVEITNATSATTASFTMPDADVKITANFGKVYTVSFNAGSDPITETSIAAGVELPAGPALSQACKDEGWSFAGWAEAAVSEQTTTAPTFKTGTYYPTSNTTLYAVYEKTVQGDVEDLDKTEGFETKDADSNYQGTVTIESEESDCGVEWEIYYGCVSTNDKIAGSNSAHMRWYSSAKNNIPYTKTTSAISGLQSVNFKARVSNMDVKMSLWYSTDGTNWTISDVEKEAFAAANTAYDFSATIDGEVGTGYYIKIGEDGGTAPSSGNYKLIIDAIQFNYKAGSSTTYYLSTPTCCTKHNITIANGIKNGSVEADLAEACETLEVTLSATPATNYVFDAWDVYVKDSNPKQSVTVTNNKFEMPDADVIVSASFVSTGCTNLAAPTLNGTIEPTYNSATIAWNAVANASSYVLNVMNHATSEKVVDAESLTELSKALNGLAASTQYDYSVMAVGDGTTYCAEGNPALEGNFTTAELPAATLTLSENGVERTFEGNHKLNDVVNLPSTAVNACGNKVFMGWSTNPECATAPELAKDAEYTLASESQTLYAVYAKETQDPNADPVLAQTLQYDTWTYSGTTTNKNSYRLFGNDAYVEAAEFDLSTLKQVNIYGGTYGGADNKNINIGNGTNTWKDVEMTGTNNAKKHEFTDGTALSGTGKLYIKSKSGNGSNSGVRISKIEILTYGFSYSNYTTTCQEQVATPVISGVSKDGVYDEAKEISITCATVGATIYYTLDTEDEAEYKDKFTVSAEGTHTITARAIKSGLEDADEASVSFEIIPQVPVTDVSLDITEKTLKIGKIQQLTATIDPEDASNKAVVWETSDETIATVENGLVTAVAAGTATITVKSAADNTKTATCTITVLGSIDFANGDWIEVENSADVTVDSYIIIASGTKAMSTTQNSNNRDAMSVTINGKLLSYETAPAIFEVQAGNKDNTVAFYDEVNNGYIYAASSSSNQLKTATNLTDNSSWVVTIENGVTSVVAQGSSSRNSIRRNSNLFACYAEGQEAVTLYKYYAPVPKVTFDANGGEAESVPDVERTVDGKITIPATEPTHSDATKAFGGWYKSDAPGTLYNTGDEFSTSTDVTLYAKWNTVPTYTVTYVAGGAGTVPEVASYPAGRKVTVETDVNLSNPGYSFTGWTVKDADQNVLAVDENNRFTMPAKNVTINGGWSRISNQKWVLVENVDDLKTDGTKYIIAGAEHNVAMGALNGSIYNSVSITKDGNTLRGPEMTELTFEAGSEGKLAIKHGSKYVYSTSAKSIGESDESFEWTISIANDVATIDAGSAGTLQYNSGNPRFTTYTSTQQPVAIYIKAASVVIDENQASNTSAISAGADVNVKTGGTLTVDADKAVTDMSVEVGGTIVFTDDYKLTVNGTFSISATTTGASSIDFKDVTAANLIANPNAEIYYDLTLGNSGSATQWHAFTVPFPVDAISGVYDLDGNKLTNEVNYAIMDYHGDIRAQGMYGWKKFRKIMKPGVFYLMTVDGERTTYRFKKAAGNLVAENEMELKKYTVSGSGVDAKDNGWNGVGNPNLFCGYVSYNVQMLNADGTGYTTILASANHKFPVGIPFFIQSAADESMSLETTAPSPVAARTISQEVKDVNVTFGNNDYKDHLYISAREDALSTYETGKDLVKMTMSNNPSIAQIFAKAYNQKLCIVDAPLCNNQATYDLTLYAPAAGEYTIAAPQMDDVDVYLTQYGAIIWNISMSPYYLDLQKGNTEDYGLLLQKHNAPQIATGVDNIEGANNSQAVQKVIIDEHVYILRNGQRYDVTGKIAK